MVEIKGPIKLKANAADKLISLTQDKVLMGLEVPDARYLGTAVLLSALGMDKQNINKKIMEDFQNIRNKEVIY